jgi:hypothetical protein
MSNRFGDIVGIDKKFAHIMARRAERFALGARPDFAQPTAECVVDDVSQSPAALAPEALKLYGYVVLDRQGGSHTSKHRCVDVLLSKDRANRLDLGCIPHFSVFKSRPCAGLCNTAACRRNDA